MGADVEKSSRRRMGFKVATIANVLVDRSDRGRDGRNR
jgi:hypothetical protein